MLLILRTLAVAALAGVCAPAQAQAQWKTVAVENLPSPDPGVAHVSQTVRAAKGAQATLHFVTFAARTHDLRVIDQGAAGRVSLAQAMELNNCLAGVNGGYFQPDFEPVGMLMSDSRLIHGPVRAKLLSGALVVTGNHLKLLRSTDPLPGKNARQAIQSGPFLVDGGRAAPGLNEVRTARRTAILEADKGRWSLVSTTGVTLAELGAILAESGLAPGGMKVERALNLDGGSSTALWVRQPGAAPFSIGEFGIVRDFVGLVAR